MVGLLIEQVELYVLCVEYYHKIQGGRYPHVLIFINTSVFENEFLVSKKIFDQKKIANLLSVGDNWWKNSFKGEIIGGKMFCKNVIGILAFLI